MFPSGLGRRGRSRQDLFRVCLLRRVGSLEGWQVGARCFDGQDLGKPIQRESGPPRIEDLRRETHVCERRNGAERIGSRLDHSLDRCKPLEQPVAHPGVNVVLTLRKLGPEIILNAEIVEGMNVARDGERDGPNAGGEDRVCGDQPRLGLDRLQILDDCKRLRQYGSVIELERRDEPLRIFCQISRREMLAAAAQEMKRRMLHRNLFKVERNPHPVSGRGAEVAVKLHLGRSCRIHGYAGEERAPAKLIL